MQFLGRFWGGSAPRHKTHLDLSKHRVNCYSWWTQNHDSSGALSHRFDSRKLLPKWSELSSYTRPLKSIQVSMVMALMLWNKNQISRSSKAASRRGGAGHIPIFLASGFSVGFQLMAWESLFPLAKISPRR